LTAANAGASRAGHEPPSAPKHSVSLRIIDEFVDKIITRITDLSRATLRREISAILG
jgi:hypothetical protein